MALAEKIKETFPKQINFPKELKMFCNWVDKNGYDNILTDFELHGFKNSMTNYFDNGQKLEKYIAKFGHSGDGGIFAIWQNGNNQRIVHLGSEGKDWFIVANNFVDFLNILAIGYANLVDDDLQKPPTQTNAIYDFKNWVEKTFDLKVPNSAKKLTNKTDKTFTQWLFNILQENENFEQFDPESEHNKQTNSIEYRLVVFDVPDNKSKFIGDLRKVSTLSISELLKQLNNLPLVVYESSTYFKGQLSLTNFPTPDKENLIYITNNYKSEVVLEYRDNVRQSEKTDYIKLK